MQRIYDVLHNMAGNNANENNIPQPIGEAPDAEQVAQEERRANAALAIQRRMEAQEAIRVMEAQNHVRRNAMELNAYYTLREQMSGKQLDKTWKAYATNILRDYLDRQAVADPQLRVEIIEQSLIRYLEHIKEAPQYGVEDILAIRECNRNNRGEIDRVRWWNPLTWHLKLSISENFPCSSAALQLYSLPHILTIGCAAVTAGIVAKYYISRLSSTLSHSITTPKIEQQLLQPTITAIERLSSMNTTLDSLRDAIEQSASSFATLSAGHASSTSTELMIPPNVDYTLMHCLRCWWASVLARVFSPSQR